MHHYFAADENREWFPLVATGGVSFKMKRVHVSDEDVTNVLGSEELDLELQLRSYARSVAQTSNKHLGS